MATSPVVPTPKINVIGLEILDYLATRLEMMVKELDFALLIVSHVNDDGKTRGSRYISKVADVRIDLSRDILSGSNITSMVISKNRFCGRTGYAGTYEFNPLTYTLNQQLSFAEAANDNLPILQGDGQEQTASSAEAPSAKAA